MVANKPQSSLTVKGELPADAITGSGDGGDDLMLSDGTLIEDDEQFDDLTTSSSGIETRANRR